MTARTGKRPAQGYIEKTLGDLSGALEQTLFAEEIAREPGLLQALDPRVKAAWRARPFARRQSFAQSVRHRRAVFAHSARRGCLARADRFLPQARVGLYALLHWHHRTAGSVQRIYAGHAASYARRSRFPRLYLTITLPGVITAAFLLLRVGTSVSIGVLLILTTRWSRLLKSLQVLRVPQSFVLILGMTYRYIYVFLHTANDMLLARKSRMVGRLGPGRTEGGWPLAWGCYLRNPMT